MCDRRRRRSFEPRFDVRFFTIPSKLSQLAQERRLKVHFAPSPRRTFEIHAGVSSRPENRRCAGRGRGRRIPGFFGLRVSDGRALRCPVCRSSRPLVGNRQPGHFAAVDARKRSDLSVTRTFVVKDMNYSRGDIGLTDIVVTGFRHLCAQQTERPSSDRAGA